VSLIGWNERLCAQALGVAVLLDLPSGSPLSDA